MGGGGSESIGDGVVATGRLLGNLVGVKVGDIVGVLVGTLIGESVGLLLGSGDGAFEFRF